MLEKASQGCRDRFKLFAPKADIDVLDIYVVSPSAEAWNGGDHEVTCIATSPAGRSTGSIRD